MCPPLDGTLISVFSKKKYKLTVISSPSVLEIRAGRRCRRRWGGRRCWRVRRPRLPVPPPRPPPPSWPRSSSARPSSGVRGTGSSASGCASPCTPRSRTLRLRHISVKGENGRTEHMPSTDRHDPLSIGINAFLKVSFHEIDTFSVPYLAEKRKP